MFSPTPQFPPRAASWRQAVIDAVDLAVAFATLESYAVPGSTRAEAPHADVPTSVGAARDRRAPSRQPSHAPSRDASRQPSPAPWDAPGGARATRPSRTPVAGPYGDLSWLGSTAAPAGRAAPGRRPAAGPPAARTATAATRRRPGQVRPAQHCTSPIVSASRRSRQDAETR